MRAITLTFEEHPRGSRYFRVRSRIAGRLVTLGSGIDDVTADEARAERVPNGRHVYFLRRGAFVKIGYSDNVAVRKRALEAVLGESLELLATVAGGRAVEQAFHAAFREYHSNGEWFHLCGPVRRCVRALS